MRRGGERELTGEAAGTCGFRFQLSFTAAARSFMIDGVRQAGMRGESGQLGCR